MGYFCRISLVFEYAVLKSTHYMCIFHFLCTKSGFFGQNLSARFCGYRKSINSFWIQKKAPKDFWQKLYTKNGKSFIFSTQKWAFFYFLCTTFVKNLSAPLFVTKICLLVYDTHKNARTDFGQKLYTKNEKCILHYDIALFRGLYTNLQKSV